MEGINHKHIIQLEVLTPLSIGAGTEKDWVRGIDFVVHNGFLYKLNLKKLIAAGIDIEDLIILFQRKDEKGIIAKISDKLDKVSDLIQPLPVESENDIKVFVKNQLTGNPIITGSSLKGAIRSILFNYLEGSTKDGQEVFGKSKDGDEFMRFLKLSDAEFEKTALVNTKIFNLQKKNSWEGGWKHARNNTNSRFESSGFNTIYESLMPEQKGYATLMLSETVFNLFEKEGKKQIAKSEMKKPILNNNLNKLFGIINQHTRIYLEKEKDFFEKYVTDKTADIVDSINYLLNNIPTDNSYCLLKMSAGSGFHSITGDWQFDDFSIDGIDTTKSVSRGLFNNKKSAKSRKIAIWDDNKFSLMGFVKISTISKDEFQKIAEQKKIEKEKERQAKEIAKLEIEKEATLKKEYVRLVEEAKSLFNEGKVAEAKIITEKAAAINNSLALQSLINDINETLKNEALNIIDKLIEEADTLFNEGKYDEAKKAFEDIQGKGLINVSYKIDSCTRKIEEQKKMLNSSISETLTTSSFGAFINKLKKWKDGHNNEISDNDLTSAFCILKENISKMSDVKKKKKDLEKVIGTEDADDWFKKLDIN